MPLRLLRILVPFEGQMYDLAGARALSKTSSAPSSTARCVSTSATSPKGRPNGCSTAATRGMPSKPLIDPDQLEG